jgi:hypothetical protein
LTLTARLSNGNALPDWLSFDPTTGTLSGTPLGIDGQPIMVRISAIDAEGATATVDVTFTITPTPVVVPPMAPTIDTPPPPAITSIVGDTSSGTPLSQGLSSAGMGNGTGIGGISSQISISESSTPLSQGLSNIGNANGNSLSTSPGGVGGGLGGSITLGGNLGSGTGSATPGLGLTSSLYDVPLNSSLSVLTPPPNLRMATDQPFEFTLPRNTFSRPSGSPVALQATLVDGRPLPSWLRFDPATQTFSGNPPPGAQQGEVQIRVTARDSQGNEVSVNFELQMQPEAAPEGDAQPEASLTVEPDWLQAMTPVSVEPTLRAQAGDMPLDAQLAQITAKSSGLELQALWQSLLSLAGDSPQRPG